MKITVATGPMLPVPTLRGGAVPRMWQGLAEQFARAGHEVTIFARAFSGQPENETIAGVRYLRWGGFDQSLSVRRDLFKDLAYAIRAARRLPPADILVTNDFWLPVFAARRRGCGRVVVNANRFPKGQFWLYQRSARIAAASTAVRDAIIAQCPALTERTRVFPNPVDTNVFQPGLNLAREPGSNTLLYVGRVHPEKGVHLLVEAFQRLRSQYSGWRLRVIGPIALAQGGGGGDYQLRLDKLAEPGDVEFTGPVFDMEALANCYRAARLFCYPTLADHGEALPVAPLEALACGVPIVVSRLDCFRDYLVEEVNGWSFTHRASDPVAALSACLRDAMADSHRLDTAAKRAAATAGRFSYRTVADAFLADFNALHAA